MTGLLLLEKVDKAALLLLNRPHQGGKRVFFAEQRARFSRDQSGLVDGGGPGGGIKE